MGIQNQQVIQKLETETYFNNLEIYAFEIRGKFLTMLSSSQKRLLCFVWIHPNRGYFSSWYCFQQEAGKAAPFSVGRRGDGNQRPLCASGSLTQLVS